MLSRHITHESDILAEKAFELHKIGQTKVALNLLNQAAREYPSNIRVLITIVKILIEVDQLEQALTLIQSSSDKFHANAELQNLCAHIHFMLGTKEELDIGKLERAATDHTNVEANYLLASYYMVNDDYEEALSHLFNILCNDYSYKDSIGFIGMHAIFSLLNNEDPLIEKYSAKILQHVH